MYNLLKIIILLSGIGMIAACAKDDFYTNGYYSTGSNTAYMGDEALTGYNRDYQKPKGSNGYNSTQKPKNNGYHSTHKPSDNGYSSSAPTNNGYASSSNPTNITSQ